VGDNDITVRRRHELGLAEVVRLKDCKLETNSGALGLNQRVLSGDIEVFRLQVEVGDSALSRGRQEIALA